MNIGSFFWENIFIINIPGHIGQVSLSAILHIMTGNKTCSSIALVSVFLNDVVDARFASGLFLPFENFL